MKKLSEQLAALEFEGRPFPNLDQWVHLRAEVNRTLERWERNHTPPTVDKLATVALEVLGDGKAGKALVGYLEGWQADILRIREECQEWVDGLTDEEVIPTDRKTYNPRFSAPEWGKYGRTRLFKHACGLDDNSYIMRTSGAFLEAQRRREQNKVTYITDKETEFIADPQIKSDAYGTFIDLVDKVKDVKFARSEFSEVFWALKDKVFQEHHRFAGLFYAHLTILQAQQDVEITSAGLTKPLNTYVQHRRSGRYEYSHKGAAAAHAARSRLETAEKRLALIEQGHPTIGLDKNRKFILTYPASVDFDALVTKVQNAWNTWRTVRETNKIVVAEKQAKKDKALAKKLARLEKQKELAEQPIKIGGKDGFNPVVLKDNLKGRAGYVDILGVNIPITYLRKWLVQICQKTNGRVDNYVTERVMYGINPNGQSFTGSNIGRHLVLRFNWHGVKLTWTAPTHTVGGSDLVNVVEFV